jgi:hypothetical protein
MSLAGLLAAAENSRCSWLATNSVPRDNGRKKYLGHTRLAWIVPDREVRGLLPGIRGIDILGTASML